jgi:hypothetical protein
MRHRLAAVILAAGLAASMVAAQAPATDAGAVFRVFLKNGRALPSYGESILVGDRVVFTLIVGAVDARRELQLISLPADSVDLDRTRAYVRSIRGAFYASTRGEVDYAAMRQEVQRALTELTAVTDPKQRLALAIAARDRLVEWAAGTYGYRAVEIAELTGLFDEVIAELRAAAGERQVALDLRMNPVQPSEPLLEAPDLSESIRLAVEAARVLDADEDRLAVLRTAEALVAGTPGASALQSLVATEIEAEQGATDAYARLATMVRTRAAEAKRKGDAAGVASAMEMLHARDAALGSRRPRVVRSLLAELEAMLASVHTYREALDRYTRVRGTLLAYERSVRPVMSGFDGLGPVFTAVRDVRHTAYARLERAGVRLKGFLEALDRVTPPGDLADVHATLVSAVRMADHACARRRLSAATQSQAIALEASSAAAGAMLLAAQAREQLVTRLYPPRIQ